jgi:GTP-dependent dephospho-CoA kinase
MTIAYTITPELRVKLKEPFGTLIQGTFLETIDKMKKIVETEKPLRIISVGDVVSRNLHKSNINPQLTIIDNVSLRNQKIAEEAPVEKTVYVKNPQGTITHEAMVAIKEALKTKEHIHIIVDGEEDLLALIAVLYAPENSFVVYGQPYSGMVIIKVSSEKKAQVKAFLNSMNSSKS